MRAKNVPLTVISWYATRQNKKSNESRSTITATAVKVQSVDVRKNVLRKATCECANESRSSAVHIERGTTYRVSRDEITRQSAKMMDRLINRRDLNALA